MTYPTDSQLTELGMEVYETAAEIFQTCFDDFWTAYRVYETLRIETGKAFIDKGADGGTNRLKLTCRGWIPDRAYCTDKFLANFDYYYPPLGAE